MVKMRCDTCQSPHFWQDHSGNQHCETCNPPITELYVAARLDFSTTHPGSSIAPPPVPVPPVRESRPSVFTEPQWDAAGQRLLRKIAEREARANNRKETQELTTAQTALLDWARTALTSHSLPTEPVQFSRHYAISNPVKFIRFTLSHVDSYLPNRPPDLESCLERLENLRKCLIIQ